MLLGLCLYLPDTKTKHKNMTGFNFYRIKTDWITEKEDGNLTKVRTEELVYASSYTEAESIAAELISKYERTKFGACNYEIIRTKISELIYNDILSTDEATVGGLLCSFFAESEDSGVGLYQVKVLYSWVDEVTAKEKHASDVIFTPANSNVAATEAVVAYLKKVGETRQYIVRDTRFDKAEAILWPTEVYQNKVNQMA